MDKKPTEKLAEFAAEIGYDDLPASTRAFAANLLLDSIASALAADFSDETAPYTAFARTVGGSGDSTVVGSPEHLSPLGATLLNGYLITAVTVCDTYLPAHCHITPEIVPPALAIAERDGKSGRDLLTAIAIGAEVAARVADGIDFAIAGMRGWHLPGVVGPFGAAAAVGYLRGLTPLQMLNAFGLAGSQAAGTNASRGSPTLKFHQSRGSASGLLAGLLAEQGFKASAEVLAHPDGGIFAAYSDGGNPGAVTDGLGQRYALEEIAFRLWPGTTAAQPTLTAAVDLIGNGRPAFDAIDRVTIDVPPKVHAAHAAFAAPTRKAEALSSFHFMVTKVLRDGDFWLDAIEPVPLGNAELQNFSKERVVLAADADLAAGQSRVSVTMRDGTITSAEATAAKGASGNPASRNDLVRKYHKCVSGRLSDADANELLDVLIRVDQHDDLGRLFELLGSVGERNQ